MRKHMQMWQSSLHRCGALDNYKRIMKWLDSIPFSALLIAAVLLGLAPFHPEPHLVEKLRMLLQGSLSRPIDIFDLLLHGAPAVLLVIKLVRYSRMKPGGSM
jgi:hypothetical protein